jgi:hypothetical protein
MDSNKNSTSNIPDWFLQTLSIMQDTDRGVRDIDTEEVLAKLRAQAEFC